MEVPHVNVALARTGVKETEPRRLLSVLRTVLADSEFTDIHIRTVHTQFPTNDWTRRLLSHTGSRATAAFQPMLTSAVEHLNEQRPLVTRTYLGVKLADRTERPTALVKDLWKSLTDRAFRTLNVNDPMPDPDALAGWHAQARTVRASLRDVHADIAGLSGVEMVWLIRKPFYPTYDCPTGDLPSRNVFTGDTLATLVDADLVVHPRHVEVTQVNEATGTAETFCTAVSCLTEFTPTIAWPESLGWAEAVAAANPSAEWSIRARIIPTAAIRKRLAKNRHLLTQELDDAAQIGLPGERMHTEQHAETMELEHQLARGRQEWVEVTYRVQQRAATADDLTALHTRLASQLRAVNITVQRPPHDQLPLLLEAVPTGTWLNSQYLRLQAAHTLGLGGLTCDHQVGDDAPHLGPYLGRALGGTNPPVFFNPNRGIALNRPPGTLISGSPGRGKTFAALTMAYQCTVQGHLVVYVDPKADAAPLAALPGLGETNLLDLAHGHDGMLDPFTLDPDLDAAGLLALETLRVLVGHLSEERETVLAAAIDRAKRSGQPSLWGVSEDLANHPEGTPEFNMGVLLRNLRGAPFARLLFSPTPAHDIRVDTGLTVITLLGLDTPPLDTDPTEYTYPQRIAIAVMFLLTAFTYQLMQAGNKNYPKTLFIDEAWAVVSTKAGQALVERWGRMGRSHNAALVLISQNANDLSDAGMASAIASRFAFGSDDPREQEAILTTLDIPLTDEHRALVSDLATRPYVGHALVKDPLGRLGIVHIDPYDRELFDAFNTNPTTRQDRS